MKIEAARRLCVTAASEEFEFKPGGQWRYGSGVVPGTAKEGSLKSPLKLDTHAYSVMKPNAYNAKPVKGKFMVEVKHLATWQDHVDPAKLRPLPSSVHNLEPVEVRQVDGQLVVWNGNHRAASAFIAGVPAIPAIITNYDDAKNLKYRKDSKTATERPLSDAARPL